jgi:protoheme IX farnesyltransferase
VRSDFAIYLIELTKPRSIALLLTTALGGMFIASQDFPSPAILAFTLLGGALAAGGANTLNCYFDLDLDRRMDRTAARPLPAGKIKPNQALVFGLSLCIISMLLLIVGTNPLSTALAAVGILHYVVIYTLWLKRSSPWNIVFGGVAGAMPLLVGWTAVTEQLSIWALWLGAIVFFWTPPHFWSLALLRRREYALARIPVLPITHGERESRRQILWYSVLLVALTLAATPAGFASHLFFLAASALGVVLLAYSIALFRIPTDRNAHRLYKYSTIYLALLFGVLIVDRIV